MNLAKEVLSLTAMIVILGLLLEHAGGFSQIISTSATGYAKAVGQLQKG